MPSEPRYVELVRVSSQGQSERDTPEDQRRALDKLRVSRPGRLVERIDTTTSGAKDSDHRADLQRLFALAGANAFDELRCRHVDRLTRHDDPRERFAVYGAVADAGGIIVDASGHVIDPKSELGELDFYFQSLMASKERRRIRERMDAGKSRLAAQGRLVHGRPPYARTWDKQAGAWGVDEQEAQVYRDIFRLVLQERLSLREIAHKLNAEGIASPGGAQWDPAKLSRLIKDEAAKGVYRSQGAVMQIPAIVDVATFEAAAARLRANNCMSGPPVKHPALVRKMIRCECGKPMYVDLGGKKGERAFYYKCSSSSPACRAMHRVSKVDEAVKARLEKWLRSPKVLTWSADGERPGEQMATAQEAAKATERGLALLDRREESLVRLITTGVVSGKVHLRQLEEIKKARAKAEGDLARARERAKSAALERETMVALEAKVASLRTGLARRTFKQWRSLCEILFLGPGNGIALYPDGSLELEGAVPLDDRVTEGRGKPFGARRSG